MAERTIDLNCDLGEGCAFDLELMPLITSANVACGFHAGDANTSWQALKAAAQHGVRAGAHPGFADREHFGRRELKIPPGQLFAECVYQVGALAGLARAAGIPLTHLKPHGALYHLACREEAFAVPMVRAAQMFGLDLWGLPGSLLQTLSAGACPFVAEGFADRRYLPDGSLVPRGRPDAFIQDPAEAARQIDWLLRERGVRTVCVHGDNPEALIFVRALREELGRLEIAIRALS
jgi:UPF0271 protein